MRSPTARSTRRKAAAGRRAAADGDGGARAPQGQARAAVLASAVRRGELRDQDLAAARALTGLFRRNGYARRQNTARKDSEGYGAYKKGDELRFVAGSSDELAAIRRMLKQLGLKPGRPFVKGKQMRQPVYGRAAVERFLSWVGE